MHSMALLPPSQFAWACCNAGDFPPPVPKKGERYGLDAVCCLCGGDTRNGGRVGFCHIFDVPTRRFRHKDGNLITFVPCRVKAMVTVINAPLFKEFLLKGMGNNKAFGNGLLYLPDAMQLPEVMDAAA